MEKTQEVTTAARHGAVLLVTTLPGHSPVGTEPRVAHRRPPNTTAPTTWWKLHRDRPRGREGHRDPEAVPLPLQPSAQASLWWLQRPWQGALQSRWTDPRCSVSIVASGNGAFLPQQQGVEPKPLHLCTCCTEGGARSFLQTRWRPQRTLAPPCNFPAPLGADRRAW